MRNEYPIYTREIHTTIIIIIMIRLYSHTNSVQSHMVKQITQTNITRLRTTACCLQYVKLIRNNMLINKNVVRTV
jgi:hypothetical protein